MSSPSSPDARAVADVPDDHTLLLSAVDACTLACPRLLTSAAALGRIIDNLAVRAALASQRAVVTVAAARPALTSRGQRVAGRCTRHFRASDKALEAAADTAAVTSKQLRSLARAALDAALASTASPDLEGLACALNLVSPCSPVSTPAVAAVPGTLSLVSTQLASGRVATAVPVLMAGGLGLKWFAPGGSSNEFTVGFGSPDDSPHLCPLWLKEAVTAGHVQVALTGTTDSSGGAVSGFGVEEGVFPWLEDIIANGAVVGVARVALRPGCACVTVSFEVPNTELSHVQLSLGVHGVCVGSWCVRRKPLVSHARTLQVVEGVKGGIAVSADEKWLAVGLLHAGHVVVYSLPDGQLVRRFSSTRSSCGAGEVRILGAYGLCFAPNGNLMIAEGGARLQEVTLERTSVRIMGVGAFGDMKPRCVAARGDVIAVGCAGGTGPRVVLFDFTTGAVTSRFGVVGSDPGQLSLLCTGIQLTPDCAHVLVAEAVDAGSRVSMFTVGGEFVRCIGVGTLGIGATRKRCLVVGIAVVPLPGSHEFDLVVADANTQRMTVLSGDGSRVLWARGFKMHHSTHVGLAAASSGLRLYVLDRAHHVKVLE